MTARKRYIAAMVLVLVGIGIHAYRWIIPPSELAKSGLRTRGEVLFKDSRPAEGGSDTYIVTFVFPDQMNRNHQVMRVVPDKGVWDRMKAGGEVRVVYMPDRPDEASIEGAEGLARPHDAAYAFVGWSAVLAGLLMAWLGVRDSTHSEPDAPKPIRKRPNGGTS
ncbi:MAG: DUF3592 domain-containing protein [Chthonomonadales bacterium]|nr:DUF3592 domain-containing protein [Chthonomonadales bacterium]